LAAVVAVLRLFLLLVEKMVALAVAVHKERREALEHQVKAMLVALLVLARLLAAAVAQARLVLTEHQEHQALAVQVQPTPSQDHQLPMLVAVVVAHQATKLAGQVEREEAATAATMVRQAQTERQILEVVGVRPVQTVELHPARAVLASSSSKCHRLLMPHFQAA
jgi:hypothetical protein